MYSLVAEGPLEIVSMKGRVETGLLILIMGFSKLEVVPDVMSCVMTKPAFRASNQV